MVDMVNAATGTPMRVHEDRVEEYKAAGHRLAAEPQKPLKRKAKKEE